MKCFKLKRNINEEYVGKVDPVSKEDLSAYTKYRYTIEYPNFKEFDSTGNKAIDYIYNQIMQYNIQFIDIRYLGKSIIIYVSGTINSLNDFIENESNGAESLNINALYDNKTYTMQIGESGTKIYIDKNKFDELTNLQPYKGITSEFIKDCADWLKSNSASDVNSQRGFILTDGTITNNSKILGIAPDSSQHARVDEKLVDYLKTKYKLYADEDFDISSFGSGYPGTLLTDACGFIRFNSINEDYVVLPIDRPTQAQLNALTEWIDNFFKQTKYSKILTVTTYDGDDVEYNPNEVEGKDIIMKINRYYNTGTLLEDVEVINEEPEKHETLNPKLWNDMKLRPEIRHQILKIVKSFTDTLKKDEIDFKVKDIKIVGSNCSYNYTDTSDLDVHIVMNTKSLDCPHNLYPILYNAYRVIWNKNHDVTLNDIPVELYVETDETIIEEDGQKVKTVDISKFNTLEAINKILSQVTEDGSYLLDENDKPYKVDLTDKYQISFFRPEITNADIQVSLDAIKDVFGSSIDYYIGIFEDSPEISFALPKQLALEFARIFNQKAVWDNKNQHNVYNKYYDESKQVDYKQAAAELRELGKDVELMKTLD